MRPRTLLVSILATGALAFAAGRSFSQPEPPAAPKPAAPAAQEPPAPGGPSLKQFEQMLAEKSAPVEEHRILDALAGTFKTESRIVVDPTRSFTSHGTTTASWILGKRFLKVESSFGGDNELKGESLTIYGYDTRTHKYTVLALDTFGTYWISAEGDYDKDARELRLSGSVTEEGQTIKYRWTVKLTDAGNTQTVSINVQDDTWMKVTEIVNTKP